MKKSLFLLFASFSFIAANAQQITSKKGFPVLPEKGDWSISFNADGILRYIGDIGFGNGNAAAGDIPSVQNATYNNLGGFNSGPGIYFVGKKFVSDKNAYRVVARVQIGSITNKQDQANILSTTVNKLYTNTITNRATDFSFTAGLGKEWRRGKTRLQGYYGADLLLNVTARTAKVSNSLDPFTNDLAPGGVWGNGTIGQGTKEIKTNNGLTLGLGAQAFIGAEYFVLPKMALGAQYDMSFLIQLQGKGKRTVTPWQNPAPGAPVAQSVETPVQASTTGVTLGNFGFTTIRLSLYF